MHKSSNSSWESWFAKSVSPPTPSLGSREKAYPFLKSSVWDRWKDVFCWKEIQLSKYCTNLVDTATGSTKKKPSKKVQYQECLPPRTYPAFYYKLLQQLFKITFCTKIEEVEKTVCGGCTKHESELRSSHCHRLRKNLNHWISWLPPYSVPRTVCQHFICPGIYLTSSLFPTLFVSSTEHHGTSVTALWCSLDCCAPSVYSIVIYFLNFPLGMTQDFLCWVKSRRVMLT